MQESLTQRWWCSWWWWWWWACLAAAARVAGGDVGCEVLDLSLQPSAYLLPTNLTVKPSMTDWYLNFTLQEHNTPPAACVRLRETKSKVQVMLFQGECVHGKIVIYDYLPPGSVPLYNWTSLAVHIKDNAVIVTPPSSDPIKLKAHTSLSSHALQVTVAQGVEAAVGCHVNCPLYRHASEGPKVKKKVREWRHEKLHFYFWPGPTFNMVYYEVVCRTRRDSEFRRGVDIKLSKDDGVEAWHLVELKQEASKAEVYLDRRLLEEFKLPDSCTTNMQVIWTVGDASFTFDCDPKEMVEEEEERDLSNEDPKEMVEEEEKERDLGNEDSKEMVEEEKERDLGNEDPPDPVMQPGESAGIAVYAWLVVQALLIIVLVVYILRCIRKYIDKIRRRHRRVSNLTATKGRGTAHLPEGRPQTLPRKGIEV